MLPAILLTGFGLLSLRKDRTLATHHARLEAERIVAGAGDAFRAYLNPEPIQPRLAIGSGPVMKPDEEWALRIHVATAGGIAAWTSATGDIEYPPRPDGLPQPDPLDPDSLSPETRTAWMEWTEAIYGERIAEARTAYERWVELDAVPARFRAVAASDLAGLEARSGDMNRAIELWGRLLRESPLVPAETGVPMGVGVSLRLANVLDPTTEPARVEDLVHRICSHAVLHPSPMSGLILDRAATLGKGTADLSTAVGQWRRVSDLHEQARQRMPPFRTGEAEIGESAPEHAARTDGAGWITDGPGAEWRRTFESSAGVMTIGWNAEDLRSIADSVIGSTTLPEYLRLTVTLTAPAAADEGRGVALSPLASFNPSNPGSGSATEFPVRIEVELSNPDLLYARQEQRTRWFGAFVLASSAAVIAGFISARRAFHRQRELSEMRSNFVSSVSHEMRAPIASVRLMAEELEDLGEDEVGTARTYHGYIAQECRRLSGLIDNVLDFSRNERGQQQIKIGEVELSALVRETADVMRRYAAERDVTFETSRAGSPVRALADRAALQRVLVNLLDNAVKHSPKGSSIELGADRVDGRAQFWVRDSGEGIPRADQERIFDRFYRCGSELRRETQGIGLGLTIVQILVEAQHGSVSVDSAPGAGARFLVTLPGTPNRADEPIPTPA